MQNFKLIIQFDHEKVIDTDEKSKTFGQMTAWPEHVFDTEEGFNDDGFVLRVQQLDNMQLKDAVTIVGAVNKSNERVMNIVVGDGRAPIQVVTKL
jgi:hypothetical protein